MAYKRESHRVLAGSLSYLLPGDLLEEGDALDLTNFRVDQLGALRSTEGSSTLGTAGAGPVRSLIKALTKRYQGSGTAFYRDFASVATGFDGEPLGLVDWKKWVWIMNRSKQVKDNGTDNRNWSITAPAAKCTAAVGTEYQKNITTFDNSETWNLDGVAIPTGDASFDGSEKKEGTHSLLISATGETQYQIQRVGLSLDLSSYSSHTADDEDKHRIWLYASKFKKIEQIILKIDVSTTGGDFTDYYQAVIIRKRLKPLGKGWARFEIRRTKKEGDKTPFFERIGGNTARNWSTVTAIQIILDTRTAVDVRFDLWDVFGSADAKIEGQDIQYYFTYVNDEEHESNPSPVSDAVAINRTSVAITGLTASGDGQVTGKYLYRTGGTLTRIYRVSNTKIANGTTTYTDTASDSDLTALGLELEIDNDPAPAARDAIGPYLGRIIAFNTAAHPARFFWSKVDRPYAFPGAADALVGNWADLRDESDPIVAVTFRQSVLYFYRQNTIWRLVGDPDDVGSQGAEMARVEFGLIGPRAVCNGGVVDYFQGKEGIYAFNGDTAIKISQKIEPIFKGITTTIATGITVPPIDTTNQDKATLCVKNDRLYFSYPESGQTYPNVTLILHIPSGRWYKRNLGFSALYYEGQNGVLQGGQSGGTVLQLETGSQDAAAAISVVYHSRYYDIGFPDTAKTFEDFTCDIDAGAATLTVTAYINDGASSVALGTMTGSGRKVLQFNSGLGTTAYNVSIRVTGSSSATVLLRDRFLNYYLEARQAKSFDSDEVMLGGGKMTRVRQFRLDLDNAASVAMTVYSDQPGFAVASRDTATIELSTTRRLEPVIVDNDPRGFLHRLVLNGTDFRLYGCQALVQVIGTWLIGSKGEFYKSDPMDWGSERAKLAKEVQIDCDLSGGTCAYVLETDLPGNALATRASGTISATSGEQSTKIRLVDTIKGRLYRLTLTPATGAEIAIYAIRIWIKSLGEPNASSWQWLEFPLERTQDGIWVDIPVSVDEIST